LFGLWDRPGPFYLDLSANRPVPQSVSHPVQGNSLLAIGPDGEIAAASITDPSLVFWENESAEPQIFRTLASTVALTFDRRKRIEAISTYGDIRIWERSGVGAVSNIVSGTSELRNPTMTDDEKTIFSPDYSSAILYHLDDNRMGYFPHAEVTDVAGALDRAGRWLAVTGTKQEGSSDAVSTAIFLYPLPAGTARVIAGPQSVIKSVALNRDGDILAVGSEDGIIRFWNTRDLKTAAPDVKAHHGAVTSLVFDRNGRLHSGGADGSIRISATLQSSEATVLRITNGGISSLALSSDEMTLAAAGESGIHVWDLRHNPPVELAQANSAPVGPSKAVAFSTDSTSKWLAFGHGAEVRLWDWKHPNTEPLRFPAHAPGNVEISGLSFAEGGNRLLVTAGTSNIKIWLTNTKDLANLVCSTVNRNLSREEWRQYMGSDIPYEATCPDLKIPDK